jgi:hypothetical protein
VEEAREEITGLDQELQASQASAKLRFNDLQAHVQLLTRDLEQSVARSSELQAALEHCTSTNTKNLDSGGDRIAWLRKYV